MCVLACGVVVEFDIYIFKNFNKGISES